MKKLYFFYQYQAGDASGGMPLIASPKKPQYRPCHDKAYPGRGIQAVASIDHVFICEESIPYQIPAPPGYLAVDLKNWTEVHP